MHITKLAFTNVGPFDDISLEFDRQVNVFVGPNNMGKSTVLMVLADILVFPFGLPKKLLHAEQGEWNSEFWVSRRETFTLSGILPVVYDRALTNLQRIGYSAFIPALRRSTDFRPKGPVISNSQQPDIDTEYDATVQIAEDPEFLKRRALFKTDASLVSDEAVIQKIIELDYRAYRRNEPAIRRIVDQIAEVVSEVTDGFPISFIGVAEDSDGLYPEFHTPDGDIAFNTLSQGTQSLIQIIARLIIGYAEYYDYPKSLSSKPGILIVDEIDAHLHPSWQRRIIPALTKHFPKLQIFCSTHSPLMLAGLKSGQVQLLSRDEKGKVVVSRNDADIFGWSADEILRGFLEVPNPTDLQTVERIERLEELRGVENLTDEDAHELEQLRNTIHEDLVAGPVASQLEQLKQILEQSDSKSSNKPPRRRRPRASS